MMGALFRRPFYLRETLEQMYLIGVGSLFLIVLTGLVSGQGFALAFAQELAQFGAKDYLGRVMSLAIVRELGPTLSGLMIAARVAAGITAEIGAMKSSNQLDAMTALHFAVTQGDEAGELQAQKALNEACTNAMDLARKNFLPYVDPESVHDELKSRFN